MSSAAWREAQKRLAGGVNSPVRAFKAVGGFGALLHYITGEDTHLAQSFLRHGAGKIKFCLCGNSIVHTRPPARKRDVLRRMLRVNGETMRMDVGQIAVRAIFAIGYFSPFTCSRKAQ